MARDRYMHILYYVPFVCIALVDFHASSYLPSQCAIRFPRQTFQYNNMRFSSHYPMRSLCLPNIYMSCYNIMLVVIQLSRGYDHDSLNDTLYVYYHTNFTLLHAVNYYMETPFYTFTHLFYSTLLYKCQLRQHLIYST